MPMTSRMDINSFSIQIPKTFYLLYALGDDKHLFTLQRSVKGEVTMKGCGNVPGHFQTFETSSVFTSHMDLRGVIINVFVM